MIWTGIELNIVLFFCMTVTWLAHHSIVSVLNLVSDGGRGGVRDPENVV